MARLKEMYQNEIVDAMIKKFGYKNVMEVPKLDKIVINMGVGEAKDNAKVLDSAPAQCRAGGRDAGGDVQPRLANGTGGDNDFPGGAGGNGDIPALQHADCPSCARLSGGYQRRL